MKGAAEVFIEGTEGRRLKVRSALAGEGVQLGIVGKRGGLVEAFCAELGQVPALIFAIDWASEAAWATAEAARPRDRADDLLELLAKAESERVRTHCPKGHELTVANSFQKRPGVKGCRRCRRDENVWRLGPNGLEVAR